MPRLCQPCQPCNADGTRQEATETDDQGNARIFHWSYDALNRLVSEAYDGPGTADDYVDRYAMDLVGNRLLKERDTAAGTAPDTSGSTFNADIKISYQYDDADRLLVEVHDAPGTADDTHTTYECGTSNAGTQQTGKAVRAGLTIFRKLGGLGVIKMGQVAYTNGRLAELFISAKYMMWRNTTKIGQFIPDFLDSKVIREIKNVLAWSTYGRQLSAFAREAVNSGRKYYIHVRPGTKVPQGTVRELENIFGPGSRGKMWDIITDIAEELRVV